MGQVPTTQRAYTLRLSGVNKNDTSWREALWSTHLAVNKGAHIFGDWLLTLRGGLDHRLADEADSKGNPPIEQQRKDRRILLALSWLSVESSREALPNTIAKGSESVDCRNRKVLEAFAEILHRRGLSPSEVAAWKTDCEPSLSAAIRDDAVWVNRSVAFEYLSKKLHGEITRDWACATVLGFLELKGPYFRIPETDSDNDAAQSGQEEPLVNEATGWFCTNWGAGKKTDKAGIAGILSKLAQIDFAQFIGKPGNSAIMACCKEMGVPTDDVTPIDQLIAAIGWKGRPSASRMALEAIAFAPSVTVDLAKRAGQKLAKEASDKLEESKAVVPGWMPQLRAMLENELGLAYRDKKDRTFQFAVMLDHALRRVSGGHRWIQNAEGRRRKFGDDARRLENVPAEPRKLLDAYCAERTDDTHAADAYRIHPRALGGWKEVVTVWEGSTSVDQRVELARDVQSDWDDEKGKFGDIQLLEAMAADDMKPIWASGPQLLLDYAAAIHALAKQKQFKVPAYRHPDPLRHPVFCDFGNSRWDIEFAVHEQRKLNGRKPGRGVDAEWLSDPNGLHMGLWDGKEVAERPLRWSCRRLKGDLAIGHHTEGDAIAVTRADRLGRGAANADTNVKILNVFDENNWNGRLQARRADLDRLADHVDKHGWNNERGRQLLSRVRWLISFSPKLQPHGPWLEYCQRFQESAASRPFVSSKGEYAVRHEGNDARKGAAKRGLSQLPGLRTLSVDLGHRCGASCAIWESLTAERMREACNAAGIAHLAPDLMYLQLPGTNAKGKSITAIYRRIASDGTPAPWAKLDRQFMIRLQGETDARRGTNRERQQVAALQTALGYQPAETEKLPSAVDDLMDSAVRLCRLGIARHGRRAKLAWMLTSQHTIAPGGRQQAFVANSEEHAKHLLRALTDWYALATDGRWNDPTMRQLWNQHIVPLGAPELAEPVASDDETQTKKQRKDRSDQLDKQLAPVAKRLGGVSRDAMAKAITELWANEDATWRSRLKWLRQWLLPRGVKKDPAKARLIRRVGGLSLTRIATFKSLYKVQKAYHMKPRPSNPQCNIPEKGFGKRVLETMERLRDQRVKQLISRIVEAALGLGREGKEKRPTRRVYQPCHAVVIENLKDYRPDEVQPRRVNRQLMDWRSAEVRKRLEDACHLHGLHLRDVPPAYTSRQSSRTGLPGIRCQDVPVRDFMSKPHWVKRVTSARQRVDEGGKAQLDSYLVNLADTMGKLTPEEWKAMRPLLLPVRGGDLFVSTDGHTLQADLNAAANIGLRALLDPDFPGRWWYVPCEARTLLADVKEKLKGCPLFTGKQPLGDSPASKAKGEIVNRWRNPSATPPEEDRNWKEYRQYWNGVEADVVRQLQQINQKRQTPRPAEVKTPW